MKVAFRTRQLERAFEESRQAVRLWGTAVGRKYVMRILTLQAARDFSDVRKLASLRAHQLRGGRRGEWALDLTGRYRLVITVSADGDELTVEEVSSHYGD